ncbi:MAG: isoprenylcysteine carboxylmethyltransferase family protein [Gammaproteobacteria bacterium]|nr:isoprenylcysteine carboxylmethyltransferase family protein [Gammaproteobacteria bacterium]
MGILRLILFLGLVFHKLVWEVLKRRDRMPGVRQRSAKRPLKSLVKFAKVVVLVFLVLQTLFLNLFPISNQPTLFRIIGTAIYLIGLATAVLGRLQLGKNWVDLEDYQVLPEQSLVTNGIYRYIRHPIYTGDVLLLVGLELALNSWLVLGIFIPLLVVVNSALTEEALLSQAFPGYNAYCKRTKRFIPFII